METQLTVVNSFEEMSKIADTIVKAKLWKSFDSKEKVLGLMLLCQSEGLHPMAAVRRYDLIQGQPSLKAEAQLADFQKDGGTVQWLERSNTACRARFFHKVYCIEGVEVSWTMEDAKRAKLDQRDNYKTYPRQMLTARVITEGVQIVNPAIGLGISSPEEVEASIESRKRVASTVSFELLETDTAETPSKLPEDQKEAKANRAELNKLLQPCVTRDEYKAAALAFQQKYGKEIWIEKTGHNDIETFEILAKEHKARIEDNEHHSNLEMTFRSRLDECGTIDLFLKLEEEFNSRQGLRDDAILADLVLEKSKALGLVKIEE